MLINNTNNGGDTFNYVNISEMYFEKKIEYYRKE